MADRLSRNFVHRRVREISNMRISEEAVEEIAGLMEYLGELLGHEAGELARSDGRKTILPRDISNAQRLIRFLYIQ